MKIIDILNIIARGEEPPKKIVFRNEVYIYEDDDYYTDTYNDAIFDYHEITDILNEEVTLIETTITYKPGKIEKINLSNKLTWAEINENFENIGNKINEIIDHINGG